MDEQRLWAPWRYEYVSRSSSGQNEADPLEPITWQDGADHGCFLCRAAATYQDQPQADRDQLVAHQGDATLVVLNRFPYNNGHLLIAPRRHVGLFHELNAEEHLESVEVLAGLTQLLGELIHAQGYNIGLNLGSIAGAGVPGHLHWHLVPRWQGDTNFLPVVASTHVISQSLESLLDLLRGPLSRHFAQDTRG